MSETFEQFKNSFSYGSRNNLSFKFLKWLPEDEAANWFQELLQILIDAHDSGDYSPVAEHIYAAQVKVYTPEGKWTYDEGPFTPMEKPLSESRMSLISSSGFFVQGQDPKPFGVEAMTQEEAAARINEFLKVAPELTSIPFDTPQERLQVRHGGYDIRAAQADSNVVFPIHLLAEMDRSGVIGSLTPNAYSFVGAMSQIRLLNQVGPQWVSMLQDQEVDAVLLVPA